MCRRLLHLQFAKLSVGDGVSSKLVLDRAWWSGVKVVAGESGLLDNRAEWTTGLRQSGPESVLAGRPGPHYFLQPVLLKPVSSWLCSNRKSKPFTRPACSFEGLAY